MTRTTPAGKVDQQSFDRGDSNRKSAKTMIIVAVIAITVIIILFGMLTGLPEGTVRITNTFIDVNGDGLVDLVKIADVILNTGSNINFP